MNVVFSVRAEQDLAGILDDLAWSSSDAAHDLNAQFTRRLDQLSRLPQLGRPRHDVEHGLRGLLVRPYILFHRLEGDEIVIVRVIHGKRDLRQIVNDER